jgi:hypothetical protein
MNPILWIHIAAGIAAIPLGAIAVAARKGCQVHLLAGTWFAVSMLVLGITAAILAPFKSPPDLSLTIGGVMVCYFVGTAWMAARRRDGTTGRFEIIACVAALGAAPVILWLAMSESAPMPAGPSPGIVFAALCLIAGIGDLKAVLRKKLSAGQRLARHLWRMCFAFFIATGSFFLGQQDVLPQVVRGSPLLFVLAFAPILIMLFWLVRLRFAKAIARSKQTGRMLIGRQALALSTPQMES